MDKLRKKARDVEERRIEVEFKVFGVGDSITLQRCNSRVTLKEVVKALCIVK